MGEGIEGIADHPIDEETGVRVPGSATQIQILEDLKMGMFGMFSRCSCTDNCCKPKSNSVEVVIKNNVFPNPNPKNFKIIRHFESSPWVILEVNYPDCTNYEGNKILVFYGWTLENLLDRKIMDPHFCDNGCLSPIARFEPTERGWNLAKKMVCHY